MPNLRHPQPPPTPRGLTCECIGARLEAFRNDWSGGASFHSALSTKKPLTGEAIKGFSESRLFRGVTEQW
jgi:hypothetical protein